MSVECESLPLFPVTVSVCVPTFANRPTLIVRVEAPPEFTGFGLKLALVLAGRPLMLRLTELDPPMAVSVIVSWPEDPRDIVRLDGEAEMEKSGAGAGTDTEKVVACVRLGLLSPVMVFV